MRSCRLIEMHVEMHVDRSQVHPLSLFLCFVILCAQCPQHNEYIVRSMPLGMHMDRSLPDRSSASSPPEQLLLPPPQQRQLLPLAAAAAAAAAGLRRP